MHTTKGTLTGLIRNKVQNIKGECSYLVDFLGSAGDQLLFKEEDLHATGRFTKPNKFQELEIVKVIKTSKKNQNLKYLTGTISGFYQHINES